MRSTKARCLDGRRSGPQVTDLRAGGITVEGVFELLRSIVLLPARVLRGRARPERGASRLSTPGLVVVESQHAVAARAAEHAHAHVVDPLPVVGQPPALP